MKSGPSNMILICSFYETRFIRRQPNMFIRDVRQSYQIWSWYVVFIKLGLITDDQEYLKRTLKETQREMCPSTENAGKYGPEKTLYLETFHAVKVT